MSSLIDLIKSKAYQQFMRKLLISGTLVFVIGILFLVMHWAGGNIMTIIGGGVLIIWTFFFVLDKIILKNNSSEY